MELPVLLAAGAAGLGAYSAWLEPRWVELTRHELVLPDWPAALDGLTILHLSDLHTQRDGAVERYLRRLPERLPTPDLVLLTGDLVEHEDALGVCLEVLAAVPARYGRFAVYGNNDLYPESLARALSDGLVRNGIGVLTGACRRVLCGDQPLWVGGFAYYHVGEDEPFVYPVAETFAAATPGEPRILLSHAPDAIVEAADHAVALVLAGHTHGGQVCLPGGVAVHRRLDRTALRGYVKGFHQHGRTGLYVSRGLGLSPPRFRLFCRPEVAWLRLRSPAA